VKLSNFLGLALSLAFGTTLASAGTISYTCDPTIAADAPAGTCAYLNGTIAGVYGSTFSNANANIYIEMGVTGLGESEQYLNYMSYTNYRSALIADSSGDAVDTGAIASLPAVEPTLYSGSSGNVEITGAIGQALCTAVGSATCSTDGIASGDLTGTTSTGAACTLGNAGCYNAIIVITTLANLSSETSGTQTLYWDQTGGSIPSDAYDFYSVVEHETDEVLGTASCVDTTSPLSDGCNFGSNTNIPSAVDLFRYQSSGTRVFESNTAGAYFSYNGGVTNGADGAIYNTLSNGDDYADFASNCTFVQDATGCLGKVLGINNDGGAEKNILDAVGFNLNSSTPEPGTMGLLGAAFAALAVYRRRRA
jgi:hypothetical protein